MAFFSDIIVTLSSSRGYVKAQIGIKMVFIDNTGLISYNIHNKTFTFEFHFFSQKNLGPILVVTGSTPLTVPSQYYFLLFIIIKLRKQFRNHLCVTKVYMCEYIARASRVFTKLHAKFYVLHDSQTTTVERHSMARFVTQ